MTAEKTPPPPEIELGSIFGNLTVTANFKGAKNKHPRCSCVCSCGRTRLVRRTSLKLGKVVCCAHCSRMAGAAKSPKPSAEEQFLSKKRSEYRCNAKKKGRIYGLSKPVFRTLVLGSCRYCGQQPALGLDRIDCGAGYTEENTQPCCATCNYAKREMNHVEFVSWIAVVARKVLP